ncbi:MAG TPA: hypothetical protein VJ165_02870, partial [candidate division Zixibacteria bacterium]|nr:hypothetical protein [candidate division Zixibacteria bacterium]
VDLAFIKLPEIKTRVLENQGKRFYDLTKIRNEALKFKLDSHSEHEHIWNLAGVPEILITKETVPNLGRKWDLTFQIIPVSDIALLREGAEYDIYRSKVRYDDTIGLPKTFGGVSGGGLWRGEIYNQDSLKLHLSGVAYKQSELKNEMREIECHGIKSIFIKLYQAILDSKYSALN